MSSSTRPSYWHPTHHTKKRRARFHNYHEPGTYMITLVIRERRPLLGHLVHEPYPMVIYSELAQRIRHGEIHQISYHYPQVEVWALCIMPDHIHMIIHINNTLPEECNLGTIISGFKVGCNHAYWQLEHLTEAVTLFEDGYNDRLLWDKRHLKRWKQYLRDNPRRLSLKRQNPDLFRVLYQWEIEGHDCQIVGNRFLLDIPDKLPVIVHRHNTEEEIQWLVRKCMACGERGGVLVGTGIEKREGWIMREALNRGYCMIVLKANGFSPFFKPNGEQIEACAEGRLLLISPWSYDAAFKKPTRQQCLALNDLARAITKDYTDLQP